MFARKFEYFETLTEVNEVKKEPITLWDWCTLYELLTNCLVSLSIHPLYKIDWNESDLQLPLFIASCRRKAISSRVKGSASFAPPLLLLQSPFIIQIQTFVQSVSIFWIYTYPFSKRRFFIPHRQFSFWDVDVPLAPRYGVYISQFILHVFVIMCLTSRTVISW